MIKIIKHDDLNTQSMSKLSSLILLNKSKNNKNVAFIFIIFLRLTSKNLPH